MFSRDLLWHLKKWKKKTARKPLILRGARQVGKTSLIELFGAEEFDKIISINLEKTEHARWFNRPLSVEEFEQIIEIHYKEKLIAGKTLLFIDEIQNSPHCIALLRFFHEERPNLHVIAAGSLLEVKIKKEGLSLPVGRVEYLYMYPCNFFEYLKAMGQKNLLTALQKTTIHAPLSTALHEITLRHFYDYVMIGGMPEMIAATVQKKSWEEKTQIASALFTTYKEDVYKYASSAQARYLHYVIDETPRFAGITISYEKYGQGVFKSREMRRACETLESAMILRQIPATQSTQLPLLPQYKRAKKLLFLDIGLVNQRMNIQEEYLHLKNLHEFYQGRIAEQIVGQNLIGHGIYQPIELYYWAKLKTEGTAEIDFCFQHKGKIVGIEVKAGISTKLRSLMSFANAIPDAVLIRISEHPLSLETQHVNGKKYRFLSLPFYLLPRILEFCDKTY